MGEIPKTKNTWAASLNGVVHVLFTLGLTAGSEAIKTYVPFLRLPGVSWLFDFMVKRFGNAIDTELQLNVTFVVLDIQTARERKAFEEARDTLKKVKDEGDQDAINKAREEFKKKLANLVHWDGST